MDADRLLRALNQIGEQARIEAKLASRIDTSIMETVCAFANEPGLGGGYLLLGVARTDDPVGTRYTAVGVEDAEKLQEDLVSQTASVFNRPVRLDVTPDTSAGPVLLRVFVPEAQPSEKPIYLRRKGLPRGAFRRYGTSDVGCTDDDLGVFYEGRSRASFDSGLVPEATIDDISTQALDEYRQARRQVSADAEELSYGDADLLLSLYALREEGGTLVPTVAGLLLFGTPQALRRFFPMMRVDYIRVPGRQWIENPDERFASIDMRGPLLLLIRRAEAAVIDDLPRSFHLPEGSLQRSEHLPIPQRVLREAIVNAVMHRSYREHSPIQIIRYSNRIEIVNPGYSLKPRERLGERRSETRNPVIAAVLHETRFAETKGSGIQVMRRLMEQERLMPPTFESDRKSNEFTVRLLLHHFLSQEDHNWLALFSDLNLTAGEKLALVFLREVGAIDNPTYRELAGIETSQAGLSLRRLRDAGLLEIHGRGTGAHYVPAGRLRAAVSGVNEGLYTMGQESLLPENSLSVKTAPFSLKEEGLSVMPVPSSVKLRDDLPQTLAEEVAKVGRRARPEQLRRVIRALCGWKPLRAEEIARLLERHVVYILNNYLTPMMRDGELEHTIPEMPRHPQQAYRTRKPDAGG